MSQPPPDSTETYAGTTNLTTSEYHRLLASKRRRVALDVLANRTAPVDLEDLAATIALRELEVDIADEKTIKRVALTLHHNHLPKMTDLGVVDYDPETTRIESCPSCPDS